MIGSTVKYMYVCTYAGEFLGNADHTTRQYSEEVGHVHVHVAFFEKYFT